MDADDGAAVGGADDVAGADVAWLSFVLPFALESASGGDVGAALDFGFGCLSISCGSMSANGFLLPFAAGCDCDCDDDVDDGCMTMKMRMSVWMTMRIEDGKA